MFKDSGSSAQDPDADPCDSFWGASSRHRATISQEANPRQAGVHGGNRTDRGRYSRSGRHQRRLGSRTLANRVYTRSIATDCNTTSFTGLSRFVAGGSHDLLSHLVTFYHFAEDGVLAGEPLRRRDRNEELRTIGIGAGVGHGQLAGLVELVRGALGFVFELVSGTAEAVWGP